MQTLLTHIELISLLLLIVVYANFGILYSALMHDEWHWYNTTTSKGAGITWLLLIAWLPVAIVFVIRNIIARKKALREAVR